jgi:hypothetical protein
MSFPTIALSRLTASTAVALSNPSYVPSGFRNENGL